MKLFDSDCCMDHSKLIIEIGSKFHGLQFKMVLALAPAHLFLE